jgi:hypothetical protein
VVKIDECVTGPKPAAQVVSGDNLARALEKYGEDLKRLFGEFEPDPVLTDFAGLEVYLKNTEMENPNDVGRSTHGAESAVGEYIPLQLSTSKSERESSIFFIFR